MKKEIMKNGKVKLTSSNGIIDMRNGEWYSEAIVAAKNVKYFRAA